ncbi:hypothetical protein [Paenibacillus kandeliae]|uniref:hypothetical protein n=1 Tax=Paenibacillus kandeliae TaxID=3231269 RepID=UPI003457DBBD
MIGNTNFGPSSYSLKGYVYLDKDVAKRFVEIYNWNKVDISPSIQLDNNETNRTWVFSKEFNEYIKSSDYVGDFYFDINNRLIYFEVER